MISGQSLHCSHLNLGCIVDAELQGEPKHLFQNILPKTVLCVIIYKPEKSVIGC